ncbi:glycerophosphodiester phosphodiesterase [bacterium]|nr:glycerophosphodiester phosphodiesterase [bacterium]
MIKRLLKRILVVFILLVVLWIATQYWFAEPARLLPANKHTGFDVIAHRGGRGIAPENTLHAFETSDKLGVDVLEMDIHLTKDDQLAVIHDATLDRTTNGNGEVKDYSLRELQKYDAAYHYSPDPAYNNSRDSSIYSDLADNEELFPLRGKGIRIPGLQDVFRRFPQKRMVIEIKPNRIDIVEPFCRMIKDFQKEDHLIIGSFHEEVLVHFRMVCPGVATSAFSKEATRFVLFDKVFLAGMISPDYIALQIPPDIKTKLVGNRPIVSVVTRSLMKAARGKELIVQVWTVNETDQMKEMIDIGVNGIMTDYPDRLLNLLGR